MRASPAVAAALVVAAAGLAVIGLTSGDDEPPPPARAAAAPAPAGLEVWSEHGCGSCHTFAPASATGTFGPDLALSLTGTDAAYVRRSIVDPGAAAAAGFDAGAMPTDYGERISPEDLDRLVAFIHDGVSG